MKKLTQWLKITCKDTSPLISEQLDHSLPLLKKVRLLLHLSLCGMCRCYEQQLKVVKALAKGLGKENVSLQNESPLKETTKEKWKKSLK